MNIMTGRKGIPHVMASMDRTANAGVYGASDYVLDIGKKLEAEIVTNNLIKIYDGCIIAQGTKAVISGNDEIVIANGTQALLRNDIIVARYEMDTETSFETFVTDIVEGTPGVTAVDPDIETGDILAGATIHEMPLYRVRLNGLNIEAVEPLFSVLVPLAKKLSADKLLATTEEVTAVTAAGKGIDALVAKGLINSLNVITVTLPIGSNSVNIFNNAITNNSILDFYTSIYGVNPLTSTVTTGQVTLTFPTQTVEMVVGVKVGGIYV